MVKKIILVLVLLILPLFFLVLPVKAENQVNLYFFWGDGCPHCAEEKPFIERLQSKYPQLKVQAYEIWKHPENIELFRQSADKLKTNINGVPFTVVGDKYFSGYLNDETTGVEIEAAVKQCLDKGCPDPLAEVVNNTGREVLDKKDSQKEVKKEESKKINIPIFGNINTKDVSLPVLTIIIGALDGFNPCAMWTLVFLISMLVGMKDRKKMWVLGSAFIIASASVYFLFMAAWLNLVLFIGYIIWIRLAIGLVALLAGFYNLREYLVNKDATCKVTKGGERRRVFEYLKKVVHERTFLLALGGIIVLAMAVNLVELICSAGFPVVYTQVLGMSHLASWQYYLYLLLYIFIFMLDDLFVFVISMKTLEVAGVTGKYTRFSHLVGGILMAAIGLLLIFKPGWLMFG